MVKMNALGPAQFWYRDVVLKFRPLEKLMLIALWLNGGTRSATELTEDIWIAPTRGSSSTLRGCLSKARARVVAAGGSADELIRTIRLSGGRTFVTLPPEGWAVDIEQFRDSAVSAHLAYEAGQYGEARALAAGALKLWYPDPLPNAENHRFAVRYVAELHAVHFGLLLTRIRADISLGWHREAAAELRQLTNDRRNDGEIGILLATALYRSDQIAEAAAVCRKLITEREKVGIDDYRLNQLQHAILTCQAPARGPLDW
jgi:DNA-binding SARP family transcriptional activator